MVELHSWNCEAILDRICYKWFTNFVVRGRRRRQSDSFRKNKLFCDIKQLFFGWADFQNHFGWSLLIMSRYIFCICLWLIDFLTCLNNASKIYQFQNYCILKVGAASTSLKTSKRLYQHYRPSGPRMLAHVLVFYRTTPCPQSFGNWAGWNKKKTLSQKGHSLKRWQRKTGQQFLED